MTPFCLNAKDWEGKVKIAFLEINAEQWVIMVQPWLSWPTATGLKGWSGALKNGIILDNFKSQVDELSNSLSSYFLELLDPNDLDTHCISVTHSCDHFACLIISQDYLTSENMKASDSLLLDPNPLSPLFPLAHSHSLSNPVVAFIKIFWPWLSLLLMIYHSSSVFRFFPIQPRFLASLLPSFSPLSLSSSFAALTINQGTSIFTSLWDIFPVYHNTAGDNKCSGLFAALCSWWDPSPPAAVTHLGAGVNSGHLVPHSAAKWFSGFYIVLLDLWVYLDQIYHASSPDLTQVPLDISSLQFHLWLVSSPGCFVCLLTWPSLSLFALLPNTSILPSGTQHLSSNFLHSQFLLWIFPLYSCYNLKTPCLNATS